MYLLYINQHDKKSVKINKAVSVRCPVFLTLFRGKESSELFKAGTGFLPLPVDNQDGFGLGFYLWFWIKLSVLGFSFKSPGLKPCICFETIQCVILSPNVNHKWPMHCRVLSSKDCSIQYLIRYGNASH